MKKKKWTKPLIIKINRHINSAAGSNPQYPEYIKFCNNGNIITALNTVISEYFIPSSTFTTADALDGVCS